MKTVRLLSILTTLLSVLTLADCSKPNEKLLYGVFTNEKCNPQKTVITPSSFKDYAQISDSMPVQEGTQKIVKEWMDSEGNSYFQAEGTITAGPHKNTVPRAQTLTRFNKAGTVMEFMWNGVVEFNSSSFPTKIDPTDAIRYRMYNRASE